MFTGRIMTAGLLAAALGTGGCNNALFPSDLPNSQFDRYAELRGQKPVILPSRDPMEDDKPNLRQRLRPLE